MGRLARLAAVAALALGPVLAACEGGAPAGDPVAEASGARVTTDGALAFANLDAQIDGLAEALSRRGRDAGLRRSLVELLLSRAHFAGRPSDLDAALDEVAAARELAPDAAATFALEARVRSALHEFEAAAVALDRAAAIDGRTRPGAVATQAVAVGAALERALALARAEADSWPSFETYIALAAVEGALGRFEDADAHFVAAAASTPDVSPFPIAYVAFQRGVMWAEMADRPDRALPLYREAVRRLPGYVQAEVHLAELEVSRGERAAALARLRRVAPVEDPEPAGHLGELLLDEGPSEEGEALVARATAAYDRLLDRHPEAYADHGAEFFAGVGADPPRALALALGNLGRRKNARAFLVALEAARAAGDDAARCRVAREARARSLPSPSLDAALRALADDCR